MCSVDNRTQNKRKLFDDCWTFWAISDDRENCISRSWPVDDAKESREKYTTTKQIKWQTRNTSTNANHYSMLIKFCRVWSFVLFATEVKNVRVQFRKGTAHTESQSWSRKNQRQNNKKEFISTRIDFHVDQWQRQRQRQSNKKTIQQCGAIHGVTCLNRIMRKPKKKPAKRKKQKILSQNCRCKCILNWIFSGRNSRNKNDKQRNSRKKIISDYFIAFDFNRENRRAFVNYLWH